MISDLPIKFLGLQEGADPKSLPPGTLLKAENCRMDKGRRLGKRLGTGQFPRENARPWILKPSIEEGVRLQTRGEDVIVQSGTFGYQKNEIDTWDMVQKTPPWALTKRGFVDTTRSAGIVDLAVRGDILAYVFSSGATGTMYVAIEDATTGRKRIQPIAISKSAAHPRISILPGQGPAVLGVPTDVVLVTFAETATGIVYAWSYAIDYSFLGLTALNSPSNDADTVATGCAYSHHTMLSATGLYAGQWQLGICYARSTGYVFMSFTMNFNTMTFTPTGVDGVVWGAPLTKSCIHITGEETMGWSITLGALGFNGFRIALYTIDGAVGAVEDVTKPSTGAGSTGALNCWSMFVNRPIDGWGILSAAVLASSVGTNHLALFTNWRPVTFPAATLGTPHAGSTRLTFHVQGISQPWQLNDRYFCQAVLFPRGTGVLPVNPIPNASSVVLEIQCDTDNEESDPYDASGNPHYWSATCENQTAWVTSTGTSTPTGSSSRGYISGAMLDPLAEKVYIACAYRNQEPVGFQGIPVGWNLFKAEMNGGDAHRLAPAFEGALGASGAPYWYDGARSFPKGFIHAPLVIAAAAGGGSMVAGTYTYVVVYEWVDANGVLHRSPPSVPVAVTVAASGSVNMSIATSSLSSKLAGAYSASDANPVKLAIYRTTVGGTIYYRLTLEPSLNVALNNPTVGVVTFSDTKADADIANDGTTIVRPLATQPQLYTSSGELADIPPPPATTGTVHRGRMVLIDASERMAWFSKDFTEDPQVCAGFNEALTVAFTSRRIAVAALDETYVFLGPEQIDLVHGVGPDATGQNGAWEVQRVQTDVGCINARSVVTTPMGIAFESTRGIELLARDRTVQWIGKAVEDTLAVYSEITSAVLCAEAHEVRWTCNDPDSSNGIVLVWDYYNQIWFTRKYLEPTVSEDASVQFVDAALIGGVYHMLTRDGVVMYEREAFMDRALDEEDFWIGRDIELAAISPSGSPVQWHRIKDVTIISTNVGATAPIEVSASHDFSDNWDQVETFDQTSEAAAIGPNAKMRMTFAYQKCQSVRLRIRDLEPDDLGTGEGPIFEALDLRVETKRGPVLTSAGEHK